MSHHLAERTIYWVTPDVRRPSGGVRRNYHFVDMLNDARMPAAVVHARKGFRCEWFENRTRVVHPPLRLGSADLLVFSEDYSVAELNGIAAGVPKVIFNQNVYRTFWHTAIEDGAVISPYTHCPDVVGTLVASADAERYLRHAFPETTVGRVHYWIDPDIFHPDPPARRRQIATMPRKRPQEFQQLMAILTRRGLLRDWTVVILEGRTELEVAAALRQSVLFVSLAKDEGFGLPAAEAMASGCYVIGYHGMGGREFFRVPFAVTIEDTDVIALARAVEQFVTTYEARSHEMERLAGEASEFILSTYSRERATADAVEFFEKVPARANQEVDRVLQLRDMLREPRWRTYARKRFLPRLRQLVPSSR